MSDVADEHEESIEIPELGHLWPDAPRSLPEANDPAIQDLWQRHFKGDKEARNKLVEAYFSIVDANARNVVEVIVQAIQESDFHQVGVIGFLEAMDSYRMEMDVSFEEYSSLKIRERILEELTNFVAE